MTFNSLTSLWVDPPSGWMYGFPKLWNGDGDLNEWLIAQGYPKKEVDFFEGKPPVRMWEGNNEG